MAHKYAELQNFCERTGLHGYRKLFELRRTSRSRQAWLILCLIGLSSLIYYEYELFYEILVKRPIVTDMQVRTPESTMFPDVYICDTSSELDQTRAFGEAYAGNTESKLICTKIAMEIRQCSSFLLH